MKFKKVAIANRGEVAVRIIKACQALDIRSVLLHSSVDVSSLAHRLADETCEIGPAASKDSYLNIQANIAGAKKYGADAIHPGFGFLSENADFAKACVDAGITFIGPSEQSIRLFGDKISAKSLVEKVGVPCIPGYQGKKNDVATLRKEAEKIGYPVLVKATSGGGGRGMKVIRNDDEAEEMIASAQREAIQAFGDERVFLEKYLAKPKHIEVQIFADYQGNVFHLFERECSVQRRHQKIIEEAGSASLSSELQAKMTSAAMQIAKEASYQGAGTIEFLLQDEKFYFLEMNTRLQVEHPVTELVTAKDLVMAQILTAAGEDINWVQEDIKTQGHAIECRLYAEDAYSAGIPSTGKILLQTFPAGKNKRYDYGFETGDTISPFYDSMVAKLIVWEPTRQEAIKEMLNVLEDTIVFGIKTNIPYLKAILKHPEFINSTMTTKFIETHFNEGIEALPESKVDSETLDLLYFNASKGSLEQEESNPWAQAWRLP